MTSPAADESVPVASGTSIYERSQLNATADSANTLRRFVDRRFVSGIVCAAASWFAASAVGIPAAFNIGVFTGILPALLAGGIVGVTRLYPLLRWLTVAMLALVLVIAFTPVVTGPAKKLIRRDAVPSKADAIVVLSAGVTADGLLPQQGMDRLLQGTKLARAGVAPRLILTREMRSIDGRRISSSGDQDSVVALAGIVDAIATRSVRSTHDEALRVSKLAGAEGWQRVVVVTSPFHSRRACRTFERAGLTVSCIPADSRDVAVLSLSTPDDRVKAFGFWLYESVRNIRYRQLGWI